MMNLFYCNGKDTSLISSRIFLCRGSMKGNERECQNMGEGGIEDEEEEEGSFGVSLMESRDNSFHGSSFFSNSVNIGVVES